MFHTNSKSEAGHVIDSFAFRVLKRCALTCLLVVSSQASAVDIVPITELDSAENQTMFNVLERVSRDAASELVALRQSSPSLDRGAFSDYVDRLLEGTVSSWQLKRVKDDGTLEVVAKWDARNGKSVSRQIALKRGGAEQFSHYGNGRPMLRTVVGPETFRYSDAEVKALERAVQVRQTLNLRPEQVVLQGIVDKPPCANCLVNLRDAELAAGATASDPFNAVTSTKAAKRIQVFHFDGAAKAQIRTARRAAVGSVLRDAGCN